MGCKFEAENADSAGYRGKSWICVWGNDDVSPTLEPWGEAGRTQWTPGALNSIDHILVDGCAFEGSGALSRLGVRVVKSCRVLGNTFAGIWTTALGFSTENESDYDNIKAFMSCPLWVVGNSFSGTGEIHRNRITNTSYHYCCAALVESAVLYMLHNSIRNIITGCSDFTYGSGSGTLKSSNPTYDIYFTGEELYYANNEVENLVRFTISRGNVGILKAKGLGTGGTTYRPLVRYYKNNRWTLDYAAIKAIWDARTYPTTSGYDFSAERAYDDAIDALPGGIKDILNIDIDSMVSGSLVPLRELVFSGNVVDAGEGNIAGENDTNDWKATKFECDDNQWRAARIVRGASTTDANGYYPRSGSDTPSSGTYREWLFTVLFSEYNGESSLHMTGNRFYISNAPSIHLLEIKTGSPASGWAYGPSVDPEDIATVAYSDNLCLLPSDYPSKTGTADGTTTIRIATRFMDSGQGYAASIRDVVL